MEIIGSWLSATIVINFLDLFSLCAAYKYPLKWRRLKFHSAFCTSQLLQLCSRCTCTYTIFHFVRLRRGLVFRFGFKVAP